MVDGRRRGFCGQEGWGGLLKLQEAASLRDHLWRSSVLSGRLESAPDVLQIGSQGKSK